MKTTNNGLFSEFLGRHLGDGCISKTDKYLEYVLAGDLTEELLFYKQKIVPDFNKLFKNTLKQQITLKKYLQ